MVYIIGNIVRGTWAKKFWEDMDYFAGEIFVVGLSGGIGSWGNFSISRRKCHFLYSEQEMTF